ncbi:MAG: M3 family metallopeptidase [Bacteroidales bacterium]|nr:M3 family metallopeptidase [Bacteroidales bacterium]
MRKYYYLLTIIMMMTLGSCNQQEKKEQATRVNPLLETFNTTYGVPPFDSIETGDYLPAFTTAMEEHNAEIDHIINQTEVPTFDNTLARMAYSGELLSRVSNIFYGQMSANTNAELQKVAEDISPLLSEHSDNISLNPKLFERVKAVYDLHEQDSLTSEQAYLIENVYMDFVRSGANLDADKQSELREINKKLSMMALKFEQHVLDENNAFQLVIDNKDDLTGLPESVINMAAQTADEAGMTGKWVFTTQKPSMIPFLQYDQNRSLREKLYKGYLTRGNNNNEFDNKTLFSDIINLRIKKAHLLGYPNYAAYVLEERMAKNPENVMTLLNQVWEATLPVAEREVKQMQQIIDEEGGNFKLESWDWWYYAEKLRKQNYDLEDSELRPYFKLENVRDGAFTVINKLYGLTFNPIKNIPLPHPDAQAYEVNDEDGSFLGVMYMDFFPRESKQGGAWQGEYRVHQVLPDGEDIHPVVTVVYNFTRPSGDMPALLNFDEVETLFHELGHALDGLFAKNTYPETFIPTDFVELPSQILEHWATERDVLKMYAVNFKTGEPIPDKLIDKINNSRYFNTGFNNMEFLAASLLDMSYHILADTGAIDVNQFEKNYFSELGLLNEIEPRYHSTYFTHVIGGYEAGYYSYLWSAVLDHDAYEAFRENGIFDKTTATSFRKNILEKSGTSDHEQLYRDFRGKNPSVEPLLKNRGLK